MRVWTVLSCLALGVVAAGCNGVFGIEEARLDPDAGGAGNADETSCPNYCNLVVKNCPGQYTNLAACLELCPTLEIGSEGEPDRSNSVRCRQRAAAASICIAAGFANEGCGDACDSFCKGVTRCEGVYPSEAECRLKCNRDFRFTRGLAVGADQTKDTLNCRHYHLQTAFSGLPASKAAHCPHTAAVGGGQCVDPP
jgi:hypothetical protein